MKKLLFVLMIIGLGPVAAHAQTSELIPTDYEMMAETIDEISDGRALVVQQRLRAKPFMTTARFYEFFAEMREAFPDLSEIAIQDYANRNALAYPLVDRMIIGTDWRYGPRADLTAALALSKDTGTACGVEVRVPGVDWQRREALGYVRRICSDGLESELYVVLRKQGRIWTAQENFDPNAPVEETETSE